MSAKIRKWAYEHNLDHKAVRNKSGRITCLDCGEAWKSSFEQGWHDEIIKVKCPKCKRELDVEQTQKRTFHDWSYLTVLDTVEEFQVIRLYMVSANYTSGKPRECRIMPCSDTFIDGKGKTFVIGQWQMSGFYSDRWAGAWELRRSATASSNDTVSYQTYPIVNIIPTLKRNGFAGDLHKLKPYELFNALLTNNKAETLFKTKQYSLLKASFNYYGTRDNWPSIKIAIRNKYIVKDATMWLDYLGFLEYFNKDLLNAKYVCPEDLKAEHDRLMYKKQAIEDRERAEEKLRKLKEETKLFNKKRKAFVHLSFVDEELIVKPFKTVVQVRKESELFGHCAYGSLYHKKESVLLLSARINNVPIETIEFCLKKMKVVQSRGKGNKASKYNKRIRALVKKNVPKIRLAMQPKKRKKRTKIAA